MKKNCVKNEKDKEKNKINIIVGCYEEILDCMKNNIKMKYI